MLVGNFGDGLINSFDPTTGSFLGQLQQENGNTIAINGLWGLAFGNGGLAGSPNTLFFAAGLNDEADGLFGTTTSAPPPPARVPNDPPGSLPGVP